jgi:Holliday junction DNA helicase RuvA
MIGWLDGHVVDKYAPGKLVVSVNGVGYDVETSLNTFFQLEAIQGSVGLYIHTVVREDAFLLYGFLDKEERSLFKALIKVNGVGPKMAMTILSSIRPKEFIQCIKQENATFLTKLPGIGKKTAERLVIEMRDGVTKLFEPLTSSHKPMEMMHTQDEAVSALEALGYRPQEALKAISKVDEGDKSCEQLIRDALQFLAMR